MTPRELEEYSLSDIWLALIGDDINKRIFWEVGRYISYHVLKPYSKNLHKATDIGVFPWENIQGDKGTSGNPWTKEDHDRMRKEGHPFFNK